MKYMDNDTENISSVMARSLGRLVCRAKDENKIKTY